VLAQPQVLSLECHLMITALPLPVEQAEQAAVARKQAAPLPLALLHLHHKLCILVGSKGDPCLDQPPQVMHLSPLEQALEALQVEMEAVAVSGQVAAVPAVVLSGCVQKQ
jgi:hypothetical protein